MAQQDPRPGINLGSSDARRLAALDEAFAMAFSSHRERFAELFNLTASDVAEAAGGTAAEHAPDPLTVEDALRLAAEDEVFGAALFSYADDFRQAFSLSDRDVAALSAVPDTETVEGGVSRVRAALDLPGLSAGKAPLDVDDALRLARADVRFRAAVQQDARRFAGAFNLTEVDVRRLSETVSAL